MAWPTTSRHERGYGSAWDKLRKTILQRDQGMCQCEDCKGERYIATEVDHIVSKAKARTLGWSSKRIDHPSNLQAINTECHKRKTQAEQGNTYQPKPEIGTDGYPITEGEQQ